MKAKVLLLFLIGVAASATPFRLSLSDVPRTLDPHLLRGSSGQYVSHQLYRNFYRIKEDNSLQGELGDSCQPKKKKWVCKIKDSSRWSDGSPLTSEDFKQSWLRSLTLPSPRASLLFPIKNAESIFNKTSPRDSLGIKILSPKTFEIYWEKESEPTAVFLSSPLFVPLPKGEWPSKVPSLFSGPYSLASIDTTQIIMTPNPHYYKKNTRPTLHWLLIDETLLVQAYQSKKIDFLRRVPTSQLPLFKKREGFFQVEVLRLDSLFFGPQLVDKENLRLNLIHSLDYLAFQKLFYSNSKPGCVGIPREFYEGDEICLTTAVSLKKNDSSFSDLEFLYSSLGGEDHRRLAEWLQNQWLKKLNLKVKVRGLENKIFLTQLKQNPPSIFRRGVSPESPHCSSLLELFHSSNADNRSQIRDLSLDQSIQNLKLHENPLTPWPPSKKSKDLCRESLVKLLSKNQIIPTGRIEMSFALQPQWKNLKINSLGHMDLSDLELIK